MDPLLPPGADRLPRNVIPFPAAAIRRTYARPPAPAPARPQVRGIVLASLAALLALGACWFGGEWLALHRVSRRIARIPDAFTASAARRPARPAAAAARSVNVLIAGLDGEQKAGVVP